VAPEQNVVIGTPANGNGASQVADAESRLYARLASATAARDYGAVHGVSGELLSLAEGDGEGSVQPTQDEPLRGLTRLARIALRGRDRILEKASEPVPYVWVDIAVSGTIILLAGGPGEGKTTLLFLLLVARMTTGEPVTVLSRVVTPAAPGKVVVLIEGEHGEASTCRKLLASVDLLGIDPSALDRIVIVARKAVRLDSPEWREVGRMVKAGIVSDIGIDTIARVAPGNANDEAEQVAIFDTVAATIELAPTEADKPIVWACAHTRKNNTTGGVEDVSGSAQRTGQADSVLLVKGEKDGGRTVSSTVTFAKLREEPDDYPMPVTFAISRDQAGARQLRVVGGAAPGDEEPLEARILRQLALGPRTKSALAKALTRNNADIEDAISTLFAGRAITKTLASVGGRDRGVFELRQSTRRASDSAFSARAPDPHATGMGRGEGGGE
jgi:hypothetical protein